VLRSLPETRALVFRHLIERGGHTGRELNESLSSQSAHKRLSELAREGLIVEQGHRPCRVSGRRSVVWGPGPVGAMSVDRPQARTVTREEMSGEIQRLRAEVAGLKAELRRVSPGTASAQPSLWGDQ